jgi:hypothetical protein
MTRLRPAPAASDISTLASLAIQHGAGFGSRFAQSGAARVGGMPAFERLGNRILTSYQILPEVELRADLSSMVAASASNVRSTSGRGAAMAVQADGRH